MDDGREKNFSDFVKVFWMREEPMGWLDSRKNPCVRRVLRRMLCVDGSESWVYGIVGTFRDGIVL